MGELTNLPDGRVFLCNGAQIGDIFVQTYILYAMYTAYIIHMYDVSAYVYLYILECSFFACDSVLPLMHLPVHVAQSCSFCSIEDTTSIFCNNCKVQHMHML